MAISFYNQQTNQNEGDFILNHKDYPKFVRSHKIDPRIIPVKAVYFEDPTHAIVIIDDLVQDYFKDKTFDFKKEDGFLIDMSVRFMPVSQVLKNPEKFKDAMTFKSDAAMGANRTQDASHTSQVKEAPGGIDLNANEKMLEEQGQKIMLPIVPNSATWQNLNTTGFIPVIIHISPPVSLPVLLGFNFKEELEEPKNLVSVLN